MGAGFSTGTTRILTGLDFLPFLGAETGLLTTTVAGTGAGAEAFAVAATFAAGAAVAGAALAAGTGFAGAFAAGVALAGAAFAAGAGLSAAFATGTAFFAGAAVFFATGAAAFLAGAGAAAFLAGVFTAVGFDGTLLLAVTDGLDADFLAGATVLFLVGAALTIGSFPLATGLGADFVGAFLATGLAGDVVVLATGFAAGLEDLVGTAGRGPAAFTTLPDFAAGTAFFTGAEGFLALLAGVAGFFVAMPSLLFEDEHVAQRHQSRWAMRLSI